MPSLILSSIDSNSSSYFLKIKKSIEDKPQIDFFAKCYWILSLVFPLRHKAAAKANPVPAIKAPVKIGLRTALS